MLNANFIDLRLAYFLLLQIIFLLAFWAFHRAAFKLDWTPRYDLIGNIGLIIFMLFTNLVVNHFVQLKTLTGFFLGGIHFSLCLKLFSFGHVLYETHKVVRALNNGTFDQTYQPNDVSEEVD